MVPTRAKFFCLLIAAVVFAYPMAAQTLADRARELRKEKRTQSSSEKVFTNESLNLRPAPSIGEKATETKPAAKGEETEEEEGAKKLTPDEEKAAAAADIRSRIEKAKSEVATLQRELDIATRENKLRTAQFYADAGNRLRDEKKFADEQRANQADMADKQKRLAEAQALIENLRNEARRAGVPAGLIP